MAALFTRAKGLCFEKSSTNILVCPYSPSFMASAPKNTPKFNWTEILANLRVCIESRTQRARVINRDARQLGPWLLALQTMDHQEK